MNKSITIQVLSVLLATIISCSSSGTINCEIKEVKTLFTIPGVYEGKITGYSHYVLLKDFYRDCLDSTTIVNVALKYSDTVTTGTPVNVIMFFNSDKDFIPNETSQVMNEINKSCLVVIGFDEKTRKPNDFIFYNEKAERIYWGARWLLNLK